MLKITLYELVTLEIFKSILLPIIVTWFATLTIVLSWDYIRELIRGGITFMRKRLSSTYITRLQRSAKKYQERIMETYLEDKNKRQPWQRLKRVRIV